MPIFARPFGPLMVCGLCVVLMCATVCHAETPLTGPSAPELGSLDKLLTTFIGEHKVAGAALAITHRGKLVYARGCGCSDLEKHEQIQPNSRFRVASLSKPITAVAILQLMEQGRLQLDDSILKHLSNLVPLTPAEQQAHPWQKITIRHCLQHTGGWDSKASFDPMFRPLLIADTLKVPPPPAASQIVQFMATKPTDFAPGERYAYSNFGYNILGRIIEQAAGQPYEQYVQEHVLQPVGAKSALLGKTLLKNRAPGEVLYYDADRTGPSVFAENLKQTVPTPYGIWCLESMDAHGGWVFSAVDLVRFAAGLDSSSPRPLLKPATRELLLNSRPTGPAGFEADGRPKAVFYGFGWNIRQLGSPEHAHLWHQGALDGVSTLMVHRDDDFAWVILFNSRQKINGKPPASAIDDLIHQAVDSIKTWPAVDLFPIIDQGAK